MKTATLKIANGGQVNGVDKYRDYTGDDLCQRHGNAPVGFYRNSNKSFKGIVFRDCNGNCTYFDRTHGVVYDFDHVVWTDTIFNFIPEMTNLSIVFPKEKKVKTVKKTLDLSVR